MKIVSYQDFGAALIDSAVSLARIESTAAAIAGETVDAGPIGVGPGDAATVMAKGTLGAPVAKAAAPAEDGARRFIVTIPVELALTVKVAGTLHRFESSVLVRLHLTVRTAVDPIALVIDIAPPEPFDMEVQVRSSGVAAKVLGRLGNVDGKIRKEVVNVINERLAAPEAKGVTTIDIDPLIEAVWS